MSFQELLALGDRLGADLLPATPWSARWFLRELRRRGEGAPCRN